jgi:hypothetical protein
MILFNIRIKNFFREESKKKNSDEEKYIGKLLPNVNNEIFNIYKIGNNSPIPRNIFIPASNRYKGNNIDKYYLKNNDRNFENNNNKQKKNNNNYLDVSQYYGSPNVKIVPNRKLSPINKKTLKV